ncbi:queD-like protein [Shewanella sp. UCD-FRSSP16_17]|uniref:VC2046/SO_2500 family protein n=1 Tax=Shewanella sp. UCD-FRSSP16_17 TaxID=1853256 RepID=UPI0007EEA6B0|nr:VC2046/SO_2500 family protein [Shewanella sp. UCD-FRSSP16_17]OBT11568.1 queD-like protein [Shewanella sp. UCD-FRSSP16_17]
MQIEFPLVNELQLGRRLNDAIEHDRRGEFGLLLSMLSADARDMSQFQLDKELDDNQKLYKAFDLPKQQQLVCDLSKQQAIDNASAFHQSGSSQFQLTQALHPEAIVTRGEFDDDMQIALANCDLLTKLKHQQKLPEVSELDKMHFLDQLSVQRKISETIANQLYAVA